MVSTLSQTLLLTFVATLCQCQRVTVPKPSPSPSPSPSPPYRSPSPSPSPSPPYRSPSPYNPSPPSPSYGTTTVHCCYTSSPDCYSKLVSSPLLLVCLSSCHVSRLPLIYLRRTAGRDRTLVPHVLLRHPPHGVSCFSGLQQVTVSQECEKKKKKSVFSLPFSMRREATRIPVRVYLYSNRVGNLHVGWYTGWWVVGVLVYHFLIMVEGENQQKRCISQEGSSRDQTG